MNSDESAWVIETWGPEYFCGFRFGPEVNSKDQQYWLQEDTGDINRAVRFSRKQDAEALLKALGLMHGRATEHVWIEP